jgi:hypothetical protein
MSIPLDRLYHYIENIAREMHGNYVLIYRFWPHGSKKIEDLTLISEPTWTDMIISPEIYCNDQEPLNWDFYNENLTLNSEWDKLLLKNSFRPLINNLCRSFNFYQKSILLHSEQRSADCNMYQQNNFILVYYWSHAIISRDWFRFAQHVDQKKSVNKKFLIYNRAWSGTREYRLKFLELLVNSNLQNHCQTTLSQFDGNPEVHYSLHKFKNSAWIQNLDLENYFPKNCVSSQSSADFNIKDYEQTDIEVVLETLFDDTRLHLTEKSIRPIACGQPFILASTHGSLKYLRDYGFQTYSSVWDEDYDLITDPVERLHCITKLMNDISNWKDATRRKKMSQAQKIAKYNKTYFFSEKFFQLIVKELKENLSQAISEVNQCRAPEQWLNRRRELARVDEIQAILTSRVPHPNFDRSPAFYRSMTRETIAKVVAMAAQITKSKQ